MRGNLRTRLYKYPGASRSIDLLVRRESGREVCTKGEVSEVETAAEGLSSRLLLA